MRYTINYQNKQGLKGRVTANGLAQLVKELYKLFKGSYTDHNTIEIISYK